MQDLRLQLFKLKNKKKMLNPFEPVGTVLTVFSNNNYAQICILWFMIEHEDPQAVKFLSRNLIS